MCEMLVSRMINSPLSSSMTLEYCSALTVVSYGLSGALE